MESQCPPLEIGKIRARLKPRGPRVASDCTRQTTSINCLVPTPRMIQNLNPESATQESAATTRNKTSKDKLLGKRTRTMKSSQRLEVESTGSVSKLMPFWKEHSRALSQRLSLATVTDCVDLDSTLLKGSSKNVNAKSWFTVKMRKARKEPKSCQTICSPSSQCLWRKTMEDVQQRIEEKENEKQTKKKAPKRQKKTIKNKDRQSVKQQAAKCIKIKLNPNTEQRTKLNKWFGVVRWTYNQCLEAVKNGKKMELSELRPLFLNKEGLADKDWVLEVPYDVRDGALMDLVKNYNSNVTKDVPVFDLKFRTKKDKQQSFELRYKHWDPEYKEAQRIKRELKKLKEASLKESKKRATRKKPTKKKVKEPEAKETQYEFLKKIRCYGTLPENLRYDSRIIKDKLGDFYICIPKPLEVRNENQVPVSDWREKIIALDPGVRTFQTTYSPDGLITEWGKADMGRIHRLCKYYDDLQSRWSQPDVKKKRRQRMKEAGWRMQKRIRNLVDDLHKKMVKWLCSHFQVILLPLFETSKMVVRGKRVLNSKAAKAMLTWSHFRFRERLLFKSREYPDCKVLICGEEFTSKTCGSCGFLHQKLGGNKIFKCPNCDWTGSPRNVILFGKQ